MTSHESILPLLRELIGNTPTITWTDPLVPPDKRLILKIEALNPTCSVKDRTAFGMIESALRAGLLRRGSTVIETTSGNFGRSLAMIGAALQLKIIVIVDTKVSAFLLNWYRAYGAEVIVVDKARPGYTLQEERQALLQQLLLKNPDWVHLDQYNSLSNRTYHAQTTANEILPLEADAICGGVGTGGHLSGVASTLKANNPKIQVVAADIDGSANFGRPYQPYLTNGVGLTAPADNLDKSVLDWLCIASDREAFSLCRLMARDHGLLLGGSSGVVLLAALSALRHLDVRTVVAVMPDSGIAYLDQIYDDEFLARHDIELFDRSEIEMRLVPSRLQLVHSDVK